MTFAITTIAPIGTVSIAAGSNAVTGTGASFTAAFVGRIFIVGSQWGIVTAFNSASSLTLDRLFTTAVVNSSAYSTAAANAVITQSGTDTSLSGLANVPGVVRSFVGTGNSAKTVYNISGFCLNVTGTLTHDPDIETLMGTAIAAPGFNAVNATLASLMLTVSSGGVYNFGKMTTVNGVVRYSTGLGIVSSGVGGDPFTSAYMEIKSGGSFIWRGGLIEKSSCEYLRYGCTFTVSRGTLYNKGSSDYQIRCEASDSTAAATVNISGLLLDGITNACRLYTLFGIGSVSVTPNFSNYQFNASGGTAANGAAVFTDWKNASNASAADVIFNTNTAANVYQTYFDGYDRQLVVAQQNVGVSAGLITVRRNFTVTAQNSAKAAIVGAVVYAKEINNSNRTTINTIDLTPTVTTVGSTNGSGQYTWKPVVENVWCAFNTSLIKRDYRYNTNQSMDLSVWAYGYQYWSATESYAGTGTKAPTYALIADSNVTLSESAAVTKLTSSFTVNATTNVVTVTANSTLDDIYDVLKVYKTRAVAAQLETPTISTQIVSASGTDLTGYTGWTLVVNSGVALSAGTKFKRVLFDTVTNNGSITSLYVSGGVPSSRLTLNSLSGGNVIIFDNAGSVVAYQASVASTYVSNIAHGKTGTWTWYVEKYGYKRQSGTFTPGTGGDFAATVAYVDDLGLTVTSAGAVSAYTSLSTPNKVLDYASYWRSTEYGIEYDLVSKAANLVNFGSSNVIFTPFITSPSGVGALTPFDPGDGSGVVFMPSGTPPSGPLYYDQGTNTFTICSGMSLAPASMIGFTTSGRITISGLVNFTGSIAGGTLNIPDPDTYTFGLSSATLEFTPGFSGIYNLRGCTFGGTISLVNTRSYPITVYLPFGTSYTTSSNTGAPITVDTSVPVTVTASAILNGSRVRLYNVTDSVEMYNDIITTDGFTFNYSWLANKTVKMAVTYQSGTSAKLPFTATGTITSSGLQFLGSQEDDTVYNTNAIDGSAVTGFTADYSSSEVNIISGANFTVGDLYAWWVYNLTTANGIRNYIGGMTAVDLGNYLVNVDILNLYLDNTTTTSIYQTDNRRVYRSDGAYPVKTPTSGGGGIDVNWRDQILLVQAPTIDVINTKVTALGTQVGSPLQTSGYTAPPTVSEITSGVSGSILGTTGLQSIATSVRTEIETTNSKLDTAMKAAKAAKRQTL